MTNSSETQLSEVIRTGAGRGLDFVILSELQKRTGISRRQVLKFALGEMLCNSLDTDATEISISTSVEKEFIKLTIRDNGNKRLTLEDVKAILDFSRPASSKRGLLRVSRGYLGNALKCIFGYSYALAEANGLAPQAIVIRSHGMEYQINLKPDNVREEIKSDIQVTEFPEDGSNIFAITIPFKEVETMGVEESKALVELIVATSLVNPSRRITYDLCGVKGDLGEASSEKPLRGETSILWYSLKDFTTLFQDYVRTGLDIQLKDFIALFRGFTAKARIREILVKLDCPNHDSGATPKVSFSPSMQLRDLSQSNLSGLYLTMKEMAKPIAKQSISSVLGVVGEKAFEEIQKRNGWVKMRYVMIPATKVECLHSVHYDDGRCCYPESHVEFPYLVEIAVFDRKNGDTDGLKIYQCVNFMASMEDVFARIYRIDYHLGRVGISKEMPVTVIAHLVCPVLKWLNYGKSGLGEE